MMDYLLDEIYRDWKNGLSHGEIKTKHNLTDEQEFVAIAGFERRVLPSIVERAMKESIAGMSSKELLELL